MKNSIRIFHIILAVIFLFIFHSCKKENDEIIIKKDKLSGFVQKGPFINGTTIQMNELNSSLKQTGKVFSTTIIDNKGSFELTDITLSSQYVQFLANGYYFNEFIGNISPSQLSLYGLSDITDISTVNINILTHLEKSRVEYLISKGKVFSEAKDSAQKEILAIFGYQAQNIDNSEMLNISINTEGNAILLAISIILQGNRTVGELTELLANITTDIQQDGKINDAAIQTKLRSTTLLLDLVKIKSNLVKRYQDLGISPTIPSFEKYVIDFLAFTGLKPSSTTQAATSITTTGATLNGTVNANDLSTAITFEYGTSTSYGNTVTATQNPVTGHTNTSVSAAISGLNSGAIYHYRLKSDNSLGTVYGNDMTFTTLGGIPTATTQPANNITNTGATLNGIVNANYFSTVVTFEYGTSSSYGRTVTATQSPISGNTNTTLSANISELNSATIYHFRVKSVNSFGTVVGNDFSFTTFLTGITGTVSDIDGNIYKTIGIGSQIWMAENLKTSKYNDGTSIPLITDNNIWDNSSTTGYCYYNNDENSYKQAYGALYKCNVLINKNICPNGWHVPSKEDWEILINYLGGMEVAGGMLKESGTIHWISPNVGATNEYGFNALPSGYRGIFGGYGSLGGFAFFWSSPKSSLETWYYSLGHINSKIESGSYTPTSRIGFSVRCIKDN